MPLLPLFKVKKSLNAHVPFVATALGEYFLVGLYVFDSRPRLSEKAPLLGGNQPQTTTNDPDNAL